MTNTTEGDILGGQFTCKTCGKVIQTPVWRYIRGVAISHIKSAHPWRIKIGHTPIKAIDPKELNSYITKETPAMKQRREQELSIVKSRNQA